MKRSQARHLMLIKSKYTQSTYLTNQKLQPLQSCARAIFKSAFAPKKWRSQSYNTAKHPKIAVKAFKVLELLLMKALEL
jgi:hypothetical protein